MDMNKAVPGSAHFSYENDGGGAHCCWNDFYNPNSHNWQSFAPAGPLIATGADTNSRGTYRAGQSIFQWMLAQGDTSMAGSAVVVANKPPVAMITYTVDSVPQPMDTCRLTCTNSYDPDGTIVSYAWAQTGGPVAATLVKNADNSVTVSHMALGIYTFKLTVTDNSGASSSTSATVTEFYSPVVCVPCPPPIVCPVPKVPVSISVTINGVTYTFPVKGMLITNSDGTQTQY